MNKTSSILDKSGAPFVKKSSEAPNLAPDFWIPGNNDGATIKSVLQMPYSHHVWVYKCVNAITQNVSQLIRYLQEKKSGSTIEEHTVLSLLAHPNTLLTQGTFFRMVLCQLLLPAQKGGVSTGGQSFIIPWNTIADSKVNLLKGEIPNELFPYSESYFEPWYGEENKGRKQLRGWKFSIAQCPGSEIYFEHYEIIRVNMLNPYDILKGISPFSPIASAVELDAKADVFNSEIFANSGRLDGQVSSEQFVDPEELEKVKEAWYKQYTGERRKRVAFLSGGLKFEQFALSSVDMQYIEQEKWSRQKVLGAYGQNRIGVGDYEDINFATIREGRKILWYDTYIPMDKLLLDAFNGQWINYIEQGKYRLVSDYTKVPALQADMQDRAKTGAILVSQMGYPPSLASRIVELPLKLTDIEKWPHLDQQIAPKTAPLSPAEANPAPVKMKSMVQRDYSEDYISRVLDPGEKYYKKILDRFFVSQRNRIMDKVDAWLSTQKSIKTKDSFVSGWEFIPDIAYENIEFIKTYKPAAKAQALLEKRQIAEELGRGISWDVTDLRLQYWVNARSVYLEDINTSTFNIARDAIDSVVKQGMLDGIIPSEMANKIKQAVHDVYEVRLGRPVVPNGDFDLGGMSSSQTIARTEMGTIASMTRYDIFRDEGIKEIEWVTSHDDRVRESHALQGEEGNNRTVLGAPFKITGLKYPRDPSGDDAGEVINCVLPDTVVSGSFVGALKTVYSGDAIEIITKSGYRLRSTINHPIASISGFIKARCLNKGDYVVCHCGDIGFTSGVSNDNIQNGETRIDNIYDSILAHGTMRIHAPSTLDLDGDGEFIRGKIDTVKWLSTLRNQCAISDFELMSKSKTACNEFVNEINLVSSDRSNVTARNSCFNPLFINENIVGHATSGMPRSSHLSSNQVGIVTDSLPLDCFRVGLASQLDVSRYEYSIDSPSVYGKFLGQLIRRFPGQVFLDEVISVRVFPFDGHVYDLQSNVGYFNSNNIISRNCRCAFIAVTPGE